VKQIPSLGFHATFPYNNLRDIHWNRWLLFSPAEILILNGARAVCICVAKKSAAAFDESS
jgi:hypothetical protein